MTGLAAIWAVLSSRAGQIVAAIVGALALAFTIHQKGKSDGKAAAQIDAATTEQEARRKGDAAADDAARTGAADRLRSGSF